MEPGVALLGGNFIGFVLNVDAMDTVSTADESGFPKVNSDLCGVNMVAFASSKSGGVV